MEHNQIAHIFIDKFNGQGNFMTPDLVKYGSVDSKGYVYEVTRGMGMSGLNIYGITVLVKDSDGAYKRDFELDLDLSTCCDSKIACEDYLEELEA